MAAFPGALDGVRIRKGGTGRNSLAPAMHRAPLIFACRPLALPDGGREIRKESKLGMKISSRVSRERQVTLPPCQGTPRSPRVPYLDFISQMHSPHLHQHPTPSHGGAGRLAQLAHSRWRSLQGQRSKSVLLRRLSLSVGSWEPGLSPPRQSQGLAAIWQPPPWALQTCISTPKEVRF